ncbi:cytochrome P450, partial [Dendrothele bispora CBS 962.96]
KWQAEFGAVYRYKACIGDHRIVIADPRAIDYVHKNARSFPRSTKFREFTRLFISNGVSWAEGDDHRRQRSVLNPPFSPSHIRDLFPKFLDKARELVDKWQGMVKATPEANGKEIEVTNWMQRATLDVIGIAAFGVEFNTLHDQHSEIALIFEGFIGELLTQRSIVTTGQPLMQYFPTFLIKYLSYLPLQGIRNLADFNRIVNAVAVDAVASARAALENGDRGGKEILSQIVRECYNGEKPKLSPSEMYAQFGTFLLAGEDTTANALAWALVELCSNQEFQTRMREEIKQTYAAAHEQGRPDLDASDLDKMTFAQAFMKESLRYHASLPLAPREADVDDVIPLSTPVAGRNGEVINEINVSKGQGIIINIEGYNRLESVWGEDSHVFRPERWLEGKPTKGDVEPASGVYGNLLTFGGGPHSCIGQVFEWRFALQEMQVFLVEMVRNFRFCFPEGVRIKREMTLGSVPVVEGDSSKGQRLPLIIT